MAEYTGLRKLMTNFIEDHKIKHGVCITMKQFNGELERIMLANLFPNTTDLQMKSYLVAKYFVPLKLLKKSTGTIFYFQRVYTTHSSGKTITLVDVVK
jgi:hypothetical protein